MIGSVIFEKRLLKLVHLTESVKCSIILLYLAPLVPWLGHSSQFVAPLFLEVLGHEEYQGIEQVFWTSK